MMLRFPLILGLVALAAVGCGTTPTSSFYTLASESARAIGAREDYSLAIASVRVPAMVDRPQMVIRLDQSRVDLLEQHRWAEPLRDQIGNIVALNLSALLGQKQVFAGSAPGLPEPDVRVRIDVLSFESRLGSSAQLDAVWSVRAKGSEETRVGRSRVSEIAAQGHAEIAAAHSRGLAKLSADIAAAVKAIAGK